MYADVPVVDNSYLHLLVGGGFVLTLVFLFAYGFAVINLCRRHMYPEVALMTTSCFYFMSESILLRIENVFVIYVWYLVVKHARDPRSTGLGTQTRARASGRALALQR